MYAVIRRYNIHPGTGDAVVEKVNNDFLAKISQLPGFVSYQIVDPRDNTLVSISIFENKESADQSTRLATEWVRQNLHHQIRTAPVITSGEITVNRVPQLS